MTVSSVLRRLLAAHHRDAAFGHMKRKRGAVGAAAHAVVAGAVRGADHHGELRHRGVGDGVHHLGAVLGDAAVLVALADDEAGDVLQEEQRDAALAAELDEVRRLERRLGEQHAVVGDDADRVAVDAREAGDQRRAVARLELVEAAAVDEAGDHLADVVGLARVARDDAVELGGVVGGLLGRRRGAQRGRRRHRPSVGEDLARDRERVGVVVGEVVGDAGDARVDVAAAELLGA